MKLKELKFNDYFTLCPKPSRFTKIYRVIGCQDDYIVIEELNKRVRLFPKDINVHLQIPFIVSVPNQLTEDFVTHLNNINHIVLFVKYNINIDEVCYL